MKKTLINEYIKVFFMSVFSTYTIYSKFMLPELIIPTMVSIIFIVIYMIFLKLNRETPKVKFYDRISYFLFAVFMVIGDSFKKYNSLFGIFGNPFKDTNIIELLFDELAFKFGFLDGFFGNFLMFFSAALTIIGYYFIFKFAIEWLKRLYLSFSDRQTENKLYNKLSDAVFGKNMFLKIFLILVVAWLPYYIVKFPGSVSSDAYTQIRQFLGEIELTTHHPYFSTLLIGGCAKIGTMLGSIEIGVFSYVLIQYLSSALIFAYSITIVSQFKISKIYIWGLILIYAISPMFANSVTTVVKDTLFCSLFTLLILLLTVIVRKIKNGELIRNDIIKVAIVSFFVSITRNNGVYLVFPTIILLILLIIYIKEKTIEKTKMISVLVLPLIAFFAFNFLQYDVLDIQKGSIKEALSIPFQQTARYVRDHGDEVTEEEKEIINRVLDYDNLSELYVPLCSDEVKATYKEDSSALKDYFKVWFEQFKKHPITYIEATLNTSYLSFYPDKMNTRSYTNSSECTQQIGGIFGILRILALAVSMGVSLVPVISIIVNPVFYIWILLYLSIRCLFKKQYMQLIIFVPMLIQFLVVIAGPAVFNHPRYMYPIAWAILIPLAYTLEKREAVDA